MTRDAAGAQQIATAVRAGTGPLPVLAPSARLNRAVWKPDMSRGYRILDKSRRPRWPAYRMVAATGIVGEYYGVEGTTWKDPPILGLATDDVRLGGRAWRVQHDGRDVRRLFWSSRDGTYWISNSLTNELSPREMYALARTFAHRAGPTPRGGPATPPATTTTAPPAPVVPAPLGPREGAVTTSPTPAVSAAPGVGPATVPAPALPRSSPGTVRPEASDLAPLGPTR
jgi:hypothetical protein